MIVIDYPEHSKVKSGLYKLSEDDSLRDGIAISGLAGITGFGVDKWRSGLKYRKEVTELDTLLSWIESLVPFISHGMSRRESKPESDVKYLKEALKQDPVNFGGGEEYGFDPYGFSLYECWFVTYNKGSGLPSHNHFPYPLTFVYYLNTPKGCSPIIVNGQEHNIREGQLIMFNGHHEHSVPESKVDGRAVITGVFAYDRARE